MITYYFFIMNSLYGYQWRKYYENECSKCNALVSWNLILPVNKKSYCARCHSCGFEIELITPYPYIILKYRYNDPHHTNKITISRNHGLDILYKCIRHGNTYIGDYNELIWRVLSDLFHNKYWLSPEKYDVEFIFE